MLDRGRPRRGGPTRLRDLLDSAASLIKRRSTVFVVSDFISEPGWERRWASWRSATRWWPCACSTRWSWNCPTWACSRCATPRPASRWWSTPTTPGFRKRFARIAAQREAELREALARAGVDALELSTDADLVDAIVRFVDMRKRRSACRRAACPRT
jgi:uncharacterized protein (DUF58 family)